MMVLSSGTGPRAAIFPSRSSIWGSRKSATPKSGSGSLVHALHEATCASEWINPKRWYYSSPLVGIHSRTPSGVHGPQGPRRSPAIGPARASEPRQETEVATSTSPRASWLIVAQATPGKTWKAASGRPSFFAGSCPMSQIQTGEWNTERWCWR